MSTAPATVMFCAARTFKFQKPPYERPGTDVVLLLRQPASNEGARDTWRFPRIGEIERSADLKPWTDETYLARLDAPFDPPEVPGTDFFWACRDFVLSCSPSALNPGVRPALRRFDGPLLDQVIARVEARADSNSSGDSTVSATIRDLQRQVDVLKRQMGPPTEGRDKFIEAQCRAEPIYHALGDSAPAFVGSERLAEYRARLLKPLQKYSSKFANADLSRAGDPNVFAVVEDSIYADAASAATHPTDGGLHAVSTPDASGRPITRYYGNDGSCWDRFNPPVRYVTRFNTAAR